MVKIICYTTLYPESFPQHINTRVIAMINTPTMVPTIIPINSPLDNPLSFVAHDTDVLTLNNTCGVVQSKAAHAEC